ncbi:MAG TPA: YihY/virulence factor BrkB family protein [Pseudomonadales bacterium]
MQIARLARTAATLTIDAAKSFASGEPFQLAAALSYYTLLSMAPLLLIVTGFAGFLLGQQEVQQQLIRQMNDLVGPEGASLMRTVIRNADRPEQGLVGMTIGLGLMVLGATTVFSQLQAALNQILGVEAAPRNALFGFLWTRLVAFALVLGLGFLLLVSLVMSAVLAALYQQVDRYLPGAPVLWQGLNEGVSLALITVLIATLFKFVPNARILWRNALIGAFVTAVLFTVGKVAIGIYLGQASVGSAYGAAGSAVVLMVWVYYASLILFFGVELTKTIARHRGSPVEPDRYGRLRTA